MDTTQLRSAYKEFMDEARIGGFHAPPAGEWSAEQVVAHVAANDELVAAAAEKILAGEQQTYYNHEAIDHARLGEVVAQHGNIESLLEWLEQTSSRVCDLMERFNEESQIVHVHLKDGDTVRLDQPIPFMKLVEIQTHMHLPNHQRQLKALRPGD